LKHIYSLPKQCWCSASSFGQGKC